MKAKILLLALGCWITTSLAEDITTLDGHTYEHVKDIALKHNGLYFICEIPSGGEKSNGAIREQILRQKIAVIKQFARDQAANK